MPDAVRALYVPNRDTWGDAPMRCFRHIGMGMAFSGRDPAFARSCYAAALQIVGDGVDADDLWALRQRMKLAFRLGADDADAADALFARTVERTTKDFNWDGVLALTDALRFAAEGDGVRAAKHVASVPETEREAAASAVLWTMATPQPTEAKRLLEGWIADGTIKPDGNHYADGESVQLFIRLAKSLSPIDAAGAAWVAAQTPPYVRWQSELYAASGVRGAAARQKAYRAAMGSDRIGEKLKAYAECVALARATDGTALVAEMRTQLLADLASSNGLLNGDAGENAAALTHQLGDTMPDMCRMFLEMGMHQTLRFNPDSANQIWIVQMPLRAMAWIDLPRALQIADGLATPEAMAQGKREIVRALLTPPDKWRSLLPE